MMILVVTGSTTTYVVKMIWNSYFKITVQPPIQPLQLAAEVKIP